MIAGISVSLHYGQNWQMVAYRMLIIFLYDSSHPSGFYLGIPPSILFDHFPDYITAGKFQASVVCHLFPASPLPSILAAAADPASPVHIPTTTEQKKLPPPTMPILISVSNTPPVYTSLEYHTNLCRFLVGDQLANHLGVPATTRFGAIKLVRSASKYCALTFSFISFLLHVTNEMLIASELAYLLTACISVRSSIPNLVCAALPFCSMASPPNPYISTSDGASHSNGSREAYVKVQTKRRRKWRSLRS